MLTHCGTPHGLTGRDRGRAPPQSRGRRRRGGGKREDVGKHGHVFLEQRAFHDDVVRRSAGGQGEGIGNIRHPRSGIELVGGVSAGKGAQRDEGVANGHVNARVLHQRGQCRGVLAQVLDGAQRIEGAVVGKALAQRGDAAGLPIRSSTGGVGL